MIKGMPQYAQTAISNYYETGQFKNHEKNFIPQGMDVKEAAAELRSGRDEFVSFDNVEGVDQDPRSGFVKVDSFFTVSGGFSDSADGTKEMFQVLGEGDQSAVLYTRDNGSSVDAIVVNNTSGGDDGVQHYNLADPTKSFMTFPPEA